MSDGNLSSNQQGSDFDRDLAAVNAIRNGYQVSDSNRVLLSFIDKLWREYTTVLHRASEPPGDDRRDAERYRWLRVSKLLPDVLAHELDAAVDAARAAVTKSETLNHPFGSHPHRDCACGAKVPTDTYVLHTCGDRLTPTRAATETSKPLPAMKWDPCSKGGLWVCEACGESYCSPPWNKKSAAMDHAVHCTGQSEEVGNG